MNKPVSYLQVAYCVEFKVTLSHDSLKYLVLLMAAFCYKTIMMMLYTQHKDTRITFEQLT